MKKTRYNEIPKEYRKDYKKGFLSLFGAVLLCAMFSVLLVLGLAYL